MKKGSSFAMLCVDVGIMDGSTVLMKVVGSSSASSVITGSTKEWTGTALVVIAGLSSPSAVVLTLIGDGVTTATTITGSSSANLSFGVVTKGALMVFMTVDGSSSHERR